jgi:hypothetical protein
MQAVETAWAIGPDLSEGPENRSEEPPEMSDRQGRRVPDAKLEVGNRPARSKQERPRNAASGCERALQVGQRIELTKFAWIAECPQPAYSRG